MIFIDSILCDYGHNHCHDGHSLEMPINEILIEVNNQHNNADSIKTCSNDIVLDKKYNDNDIKQEENISQGYVLKEKNNQNNCNELINKPNSKSAHTAIVLTIGLTVHNLFESISIGLSSTLDKLIVIMIGVCVHKLIDSFFLGMMFMKSNMPYKSVIMFIFSMTGVVGVLIGFILQSDAPIILQAIMTSLTTGTFL